MLELSAGNDVVVAPEVEVRNHDETDSVLDAAHDLVFHILVTHLELDGGIARAGELVEVILADGTEQAVGD